MDRLKYVLLFSALFPVVSGALVIAALSFGYYTWPAILGAALIGFVLSFPIARHVSRRIKRDDPNFDHRHEPKNTFLPDPNAREV
ncbi:MAG: hypothetical protein HLUCCA08_16455 [Rhodobacteraceae bacterium HLUCCA08]|nr:MAG: hypothetical protein HLUCCA08_16455 [Rhodobacteraceae bacterium HLUCCA08]